MLLSSCVRRDAYNMFQVGGERGMMVSGRMELIMYRSRRSYTLLLAAWKRYSMTPTRVFF